MQKLMHLISVTGIAIAAIRVCSADAAIVASYQFEEGIADTAASGDNSILDTSGNGLHGSPLGVPIYRNFGGLLGLELDDGLDGVIVADSPMFELTESLSISATIRLDEIPSRNRQIVWRGDTETGAGSDPYRLFIRNGGQLRFAIGTEARDRVLLDSPSPIPTGQLVAVAGSLNDVTGEMLLFVNGEVVASMTTPERARGSLDPTLEPVLSIGSRISGTDKPGEPTPFLSWFYRQRSHSQLCIGDS